MTITTILLDLDDTLLTINMAKFVRAYIKGLALTLADFAPLERTSTALLKATGAIVKNDDPDLTNEHVFFDAFLPHFNGSLEQIRPRLTDYFTAHYADLKQYTRARPAAPQLIRTLLAQDYKLVVATNPLYPKPAIDQRLAWAGVLDFPYRLVTTLENMHHCKPSPYYYQEILQRINSRPDETLMVGDDPHNDMAPARSLGCKTWWIPGGHAANGVVSADYQGSLAELLAWVKAGGLAAC